MVDAKQFHWNKHSANAKGVLYCEFISSIWMCLKFF